MANGYFPGKKPAKRSAIITPRTAQEMQIAAMPRMAPEVRKTLRDATPLRVGGSDLVEGVDRVMRTPADHKAAGVQIKGAPVSLRSDPPSPSSKGHVAPLKVARLYLRVSTEEQDLARQEALIEAARAAGFYVAGIYREKASGARADRPELLRMIADLQPGEAVVAERIDRLSRLPLPEAEQLVASIQAKGARLAIPGVVDLSDLAGEAEGVAKIVLEAMQTMLLRLALQMAREDYEDRRERQRQGIDIAKAEGESVLHSLYRLADYPVLAALSRDRSQATRLDGRACRYIYEAERQQIDWRAVSAHELDFVRSLGIVVQLED